MNAIVQAEKRPANAVAADSGTGGGGDLFQYLTFMLGQETFAIRILSVKEIIEYENMTSVPMMPECVRGVINLRGAVVPVMDLSMRLGRQPSAVTKRTCIVIVETAGQDERHTMGVIVDAVNAVIEIPASEIEPAPSLGTRIRSDFVQGMGKVNGKFIILMNIDEALSIEGIDAQLELSEAQ